MSIPKTQKKLRESQFFLAKMYESTSKSFGEQEEFDFYLYLSAFISASRSVTFVLEKEQPNLYKQYFKGLMANLPPNDQRLLKFMNSERVEEVHRLGSTRVKKDKPIPINTSYQDPSGEVIVTGPPKASRPLATIFKPMYYFYLGKEKLEVTSVCSRYINLLRELVDNFVDGKNKS